MNLLAENFWDNQNLSEWEIPFGLWIEEIVFWLTTNIGGLLDAIKWPVDQMLKMVIDNLLQDWLPWPVVLLMFLLLGASTRNFKVGLGSAVALLICGLLGDEFWDLTMGNGRHDHRGGDHLRNLRDSFGRSLGPGRRVLESSAADP